MPEAENKFLSLCYRCEEQRREKGKRGYKSAHEILANWGLPTRGASACGLREIRIKECDSYVSTVMSRLLRRCALAKMADRA